MNHLFLSLKEKNIFMLHILHVSNETDVKVLKSCFDWEEQFCKNPRIAHDSHDLRQFI